MNWPETACWFYYGKAILMLLTLKTQCYKLSHGRENGNAPYGSISENPGNLVKLPEIIFTVL